jgi:hypothetical protein
MKTLVAIILFLLLFTHTLYSGQKVYPLSHSHITVEGHDYLVFTGPISVQVVPIPPDTTNPQNRGIK